MFNLDGIRAFEVKSTNYNQKFCWIDFFNSDMASEGKHKLEKYGERWLGRELKVEWALITTVLCARDFDSTVSVEKLGEVFGEFGPLANITKKRNDFALIEFESPIDAYMARDELNQTVKNKFNFNLSINYSCWNFLFCFLISRNLKENEWLYGQQVN